MILLGYLLTFGWVFLVLGATLALKKRLHTGDEVSRKIVHICVAFAWVPMTLCFGVTWHMVVPPAVFIVLNALSYQKNLLSAMERTDASRRSLGTVYYAISMTVMSVWTVLMPECLAPYGVGLFCMALGDGLAPVFGSIRRGNRVLFARRTLYGSIGLFLVCLLVIVVMSTIFDLPLALWQMLVTALAAVGLELVGVKGLDNLTLPLGVFLLVFAFTL